MNNQEKSTFVKTKIALALIELMHEKDFNDINISEITDRAEVGRVSFYRNFENKDDVLRYYISSETESWLDKTPDKYLPNDRIQEFVVFLLEHMYEYRDFFELLIRYGKMYLLEAEFDKQIHLVLQDTYDPWRIACISGGFYKLFCYWAQTGYERSPQEIAEYIK